MGASCSQTYLESIRQTLTDARQEREFYWPLKRPRRFLYRIIFDLLTFILAPKGIILARDIQGDGFDRRPGLGSGWLEATSALTLLGKQRLDNLQWCVEEVLKRKVPGDLIETGVWRGGACILMRAILKAHGIRDRKVWLADSFEGLPPPDPDRYPVDRRSTFHEQHGFAISLTEVQSNFEKYGLLDDQVEFVKGWFSETLPKLAGHVWSVIRLDGDMYQSTWEALESLYPGLSIDGFVIIDDFGALPGCRQAVLDYRERYGITEEIQEIDWSAVYWRRTSRRDQIGSRGKNH
jgi:O-methyltransferase